MTVTIEVYLKPVECANCGVVFGITSRFMENRRKDHQGFFCPLGHGNTYLQKTSEEIAFDNLTRERAMHDQTKSSLLEKEKSLIKITERIKNGVCPCCNRTFLNLQRHMKNKHPHVK